MGYRIRIALLVLCALVVMPGSQMISRGHTAPDTARLAALATAPTDPASVTVPDAPVVVPTGGAVDTGGWSQAASAVDTSSSHPLFGDVLSAYTLAVAAAPAACHLPLSLLAAIGQVESGNLAGHQLDASHRVVPAIIGPVLDGKPFQAVRDTDAGQWDGDLVWDRAVGPMQLIPATWRLVGVDMDGDGKRDPQDVYDAAGAAMTYLCAGGRDLGTPQGLTSAVLAYNHSADYLSLVMGWKAVYDHTDLSGLGVPILDAWALAPTPEAATATPTASTRTGHPSATPSAVSGPTVVARPSATVPAAPATTTQSPSPQSPGPQSPTSSTGSQTPSQSPSGTPATVGPSPASPEPTASSPEPTAPSSPEPTPTPSPDPSPLPTCPAPTPVDPTDPAAPASPDPVLADPAPADETPTPIPDTSTPEKGDLCLPLPTDPETTAPAPEN